MEIFTISFSDEMNGKAISGEGDIFFTKDGGKSWYLNPSQSTESIGTTEECIWSTDVCCLVMLTTDSGKNWFPYNKERQEHFCTVYLKDIYTSYSFASEFLNKVTTKIFWCMKSNEVGMLVNKPQQCTEYYRNPTEGWAVGWCIKEFVEK